MKTCIIKLTEDEYQLVLNALWRQADACGDYCDTRGKEEALALKARLEGDNQQK